MHNKKTGGADLQTCHWCCAAVCAMRHAGRMAQRVRSSMHGAWRSVSAAPCMVPGAVRTLQGGWRSVSATPCRALLLSYASLAPAAAGRRLWHVRIPTNSLPISASMHELVAQRQQLPFTLFLPAHMHVCAAGCTRDMRRHQEVSLLLSIKHWSLKTTPVGLDLQARPGLPACQA